MNTRTKIVGRAGLVMISVALASGCASHGPPEAAPEWAGQTPASPSPMTEANEVRANELMPELFGGTLPSVAEFEREDGTRVRITTERASDGSFVMTERAGGNMISRSEIAVTDAGVVLGRITNAGSETITEFSPAMVLIPMRARAGDAVEQTLAMTVRPMDQPEKIKHRGHATYRIEFAGMQSVTLPGGRADAAAMVERLDAKFTGASAQNIARKWYQPGQGMIARQTQESVSVLGLPGERKEQRLRRVE